LIHNGIEFGMLQAIGEGMALLERYREPLPVAGILGCWSHGSVIRSWLVDLMEAAYRDQHGFGAVSAYVEDTGEVNWLVDDALRMEVSIPVISQSVMQLLASRDNQTNLGSSHRHDASQLRRRRGRHPSRCEEGTDYATLMIIASMNLRYPGESIARAKHRNSPRWPHVMAASRSISLRLDWLVS
jgi:6-phosphogluconate dehydrogenase